MTTVVRDAAPGDGPGIAALITKEAPHFDLKGYPDDVWPDTMVVLVAEVAGRVVGWLEGILDGAYAGAAAPAPAPHGYVLAVVVDGGLRRQGIGTALITAFLEEARAEKVEWVFLIPEGGEGFEGRVRFFDRVGFTPVEDHDEDRLVMGAWT
ncbi:GNAT family N-acetyltransferase [Nocardiopsis sp. MG754419]|uniref:GNAT family N-acetyltransferase n=1 Tax=Nocardiopsis sp. MG754419 TaxID=2259865 RepID=UPI001BA503CC|nr:GNAT family N-acetyltransferase [Nocardiopsis sp. MG754419]MBR8741949.1 GNAT family N-acetyltransferase [Nocardiopsis sp. MG754419]